MNSVLLLQIAALILLFIGSAFYSSAETALFALNPLHIEEIRARNPRIGELLASMLHEPTRLLSTILIGNTLVNVAAVNVGLLLARSLFPDNLGLATSISVPGMTLLLLLFGEIVPKRVAMRHPTGVSLRYASSLHAQVRFMTPVRTILETVVSWITPELHAADKTLTEEEVLTVVEVGEENGVFDAEERTMVDGIMRLEDIQAADVMTPRVDLIGIDLDDPLDKQIAIARDVQFRHVPVYRETPDNILGFLDVPRFLLGDLTDLNACTKPPLHVSETMTLDTILTMLQHKDQRVARVIDEYGGTAGIITRGDILEEITDDVEGEYGHEPPDIQQLGPETWMVEGNTSLEELNHELELELEAEGADRISGWTIAHAGHLVRRGEVVAAQHCEVRVQQVRKHRVTSVILTKLAPDESEEALD